MAALARAATPAKADPRRDPRYQRVVAKLELDARRLRQHPTARQKAAEPAKAAKGPPNEKAAGARAQQVDKLDDAKAPKPETKSFLATLQAEIAKAMPKNLGDTEKFMQGGSAEAMKGSLKGNVAQQKDASTGDMKSASQATPNEAAAPAKPVTPIALEAPTPAPKVDGAEAMPVPKPEAEVSLQASKTEVQGQLDQERLSETRLKKANDPRFSSVLTAQGSVAKQADSAPGQYRGKEAGVLGQAAAKAMDVARSGAGLLLGVKGGSKAKVQSRQEQQKAKEELELKDFSDFVVKTFQGAKKAVDDRLAALDTKVNELFDQGITGALASMKDFVDSKLLRYKLERYLGVPWGAALWLKDQLLDLPIVVGVFYEAGRKQFTNIMNALAVKVASLVEGELSAAKKDVKQAQVQIAARQAKLSPGVQARGATLQAEFNDKFAELESGIEDKKQQLAEGLAQKYKEAFDKADESLKALQDENKGLVTKAKDKIGEVIKALKEFKERLLGVLKKGANAVQIILDDPIQFLKYLLSAIKLGFTQFADNITTHLKAGFIKWMFGSLTKLGIEPPTDLSLGQILKLVLGVLGITYARMREKAVKLLGPTAVTVIEKVAEYIQAMIAGGPAALWEKVKEDLGNLKEMVIDAIQGWLITTIVKKAVAKVVSMFNPVGAIIQAILLIVDVVTFVVEKAMQLLDFVEAVVNSLYDIATGAIGTAANWIEQALGRMVPILIGFLGQLLGLGGITEKIKEFIKKIQDKVDKAIDKAIAKVVEVVKKVVGAVKAGAKALQGWWKRQFKFSVDGQSHRLFAAGDGKSAQLRVASKEMSLRDFVATVVRTKKNGAAIDTVVAAQSQIETLRTQRKPAKPDERDAVIDDQIDKHFDTISQHLPILFGGDEWGTESNPLQLAYPKKSASLYRTLYLGPRVAGRLKQSDLQARAGTKQQTVAPGFDRTKPIKTGPAALDAWIAKGGVVRAYTPFSQQPWPDGGNHGSSPHLGVAPKFQSQVGTSFTYEQGRTPGGSKLNDALKRFGYFGRKNGGENSDGDHVLEAQLIGDEADQIPNMWPLDKFENRHGEVLEARADCEVPERPDLKFKGLRQAANSKDLKRRKGKGLRIMIKSATAKT